MLKFLSFLLGLVGLMAASAAQAGVITTVEWETKPGAPWAYSAGAFGNGATIDCAVPASPSGGCALRMIYPAGTYSTSFGGGRAEYGLNGEPTDLYVGAWMRYSNPMTFHPTGHKANFFILAGSNPGCRNISIGYRGGELAGDPQICWGIGTQTYKENAAIWDETAHLNEWHWYEMRVNVTTPGSTDLNMQVWIDGKLYLNFANLPFRAAGDTRGFGFVQHTAEWGGGGGTIPTTCYWWIDHTVISTTPIGIPGGVVPGSDTTPPATPQNFQVAP